MMSGSSLVEVLSYKNHEVVSRFAKEKALSWADAEDIFQETKRWLWLCGSLRGKPVNMVGEAFVIDEMWHVFLLFTREYAAFCERFFGEFIHHTPKAEESGGNIEERRAGLKQDYELIYKHLGPEILIKWCHEYPKRFEALRPHSTG